MSRSLFQFCARWCWVAAVYLAICMPEGIAQAKSGKPGKPAMPRAQRHESRHEIDQLEQAWQDAIVHGNVQAMDSLLADDYIAITAGGDIRSKEQTLANMKDGTVHLTSIEVSDRKVRFYGQTALVTSRVELTGTSPEGDFSGSYRYTRVYVRDEHGAWKIVSFEASRISAPDEHK